MCRVRPKISDDTRAFGSLRTTVGTPMSSTENDDPRLLRRRSAPSPPGARLAMASPPGYADDGFQFGEAARWLAFVAPYAAFASYVHAALSIKHGVLGFLEAFAVSLDAPVLRARARAPCSSRSRPSSRGTTRSPPPRVRGHERGGRRRGPQPRVGSRQEANVARSRRSSPRSSTRRPSGSLPGDDDDDDDASSAGDDDSSPSRPALRMHRSPRLAPLCDVGPSAERDGAKALPKPRPIVASCGFAARLWVLAPSSGGWARSGAFLRATTTERGGKMTASFSPGSRTGTGACAARRPAVAAAASESGSEAKKIRSGRGGAASAREAGRGRAAEGVEVGNVWW